MMFKTLPDQQISQMLEKSAALHSHLCPRQVLGVRLGLLASRLLGFEAPDQDKRFITLVETDGCAADGVSVATGCTVGNRRLMVLDFGKVAATFVEIQSCSAIRLIPRCGVREAAQRYAPDAKSRWNAQLQAYQVMPDEELLEVQKVKLKIPLEKLLSKPGSRVNCDTCGEEIINEREVVTGESVLCRACAGQSYYRLVGQEGAQLVWTQGIDANLIKCEG